MPWLQLFIDAQRNHVAGIEAALLNAGAVSVTLQDNADQPIFEPGLGETPLWQQTRITGLFTSNTDTEITNQVLHRQLTQASANYRWEQLEDKDWERAWMDNYHPIQCAEHLWICPSWREPPDHNAINILLDPGLAFGTGTHPTTFLCMQWLAQQTFSEREIIDYGCGSGILGITALLLGAHTATGIDIDPQALIATKDNVIRNGLNSDDFQVYLPSACPQGDADIVIANILAGPLAELADELLTRLKRGGQLCLSGILAPQADAVMAAYSPHIEFDPVAQKDEWVRLSGVKKQL